MTINEAKEIIIEILKNNQGIRLLKLYDIFVREHKGKLIIENSKFEQIIENLIREDKIKKFFSNIEEENVYYVRIENNKEVPIYAKPRSCYKCRFGIVGTETASRLDLYTKKGCEKLCENLEEYGYGCLFDPEVKITNSSTFGWLYGDKPDCPLLKE